MIFGNNKSLGKYLRQKREMNHLTQIQVAKLFKYRSSQFISNFERGTCGPPMKVLRKLISLYKIDPGDIIELLMDEFRKELGRNLKIR